MSLLSQMSYISGNLHVNGKPERLQQQSAEGLWFFCENEVFFLTSCFSYLTEWPSGIQRRACCLQHGRSWVQAPNLHQCLWTHLQVHGSKRLSCHADLYIVSRCHTRGEPEDHTSEKACKRDPPWLWDPGQMSWEVQNRGIHGPTKGRMSSQN